MQRQANRARSARVNSRRPGSPMAITNQRGEPPVVTTVRRWMWRMPERAAWPLRSAGRKATPGSHTRSSQPLSIEGGPWNQVG